VEYRVIRPNRETASVFELQKKETVYVLMNRTGRGKKIIVNININIL